MNTDLKHHPAFTLIELMVVLMILSVMVVLVSPYALRSNENLQLREHCLNVAGLVRYTRKLAEIEGKPVRLVINTRERIYYIQIADDDETGRFTNVDHIRPNPVYLSEAVQITDIDGFDLIRHRYFMVFDSHKPWPSGSLSLSTVESTKTIVIEGSRVEIENSEF